MRRFHLSDGRTAAAGKFRGSLPPSAGKSNGPELKRARSRANPFAVRYSENLCLPLAGLPRRGEIPQNSTPRFDQNRRRRKFRESLPPLAMEHAGASLIKAEDRGMSNEQIRWKTLRGICLRVWGSQIRLGRFCCPLINSENLCPPRDSANPPGTLSRASTIRGGREAA